MKGKRFFTIELTVFTIIAGILLVLLMAVGINFIINLNAQAEVDANMQTVYWVVIALFVSVVLLIIGIMAVVFITRYKMVSLKKRTGRNLTNLTVEEVTTSELDEISKFYDQIVDEVVSVGNLPRWKKGVYPARDYLEKAITDKTLFSVRHEGKIIAAFTLSLDADGDYSVGRWSKNLKYGEYFVIHALAVQKDFQSQGIARHIVKYAIKLSEEFGAKAVRADCTLVNGKAMRLFESVGFKSAGAFDLKRNVEGATCFQLYEYIIKK